MFRPAKFYRIRLLLFLNLGVLLPAHAQMGVSSPVYEEPPISYSASKPNDAVARLAKRISSGEVKLAGSDNDILRAVLHELAVPVESQVVVFSRTSLQAGLIRPNHPRAIYFSDSIYVGWVPGGLIEVAAIDDQLGPIFYAFDPQDGRTARRSFVRESSCLRCHGDNFGRDIPSLFARSVVTNDRGDPLSRRGNAELVDEATPFDRRWAGWYVTGYEGRSSHRGNAFGLERGDDVEFSPSTQRPMELAAFFDTSKYLAPTSDVVALLVFQHQLDMHNSLTRAAYSYRRATSVNEPNPEATQRALTNAATDVVNHLLFRHVAPLPQGIVGNPAFRQAFTADAPRSGQGDALKDLSLQGQLFANRCSFLIYSDSFRALPAPLKERIFDDLYSVLQDERAESPYAYLGRGERQRILAILSETLPAARIRFQRAR